MRKKQLTRDFDYYIDEYMYNCRSRKLRPKTMQSYAQTRMLFERWCLEEANITETVSTTTNDNDIRNLRALLRFVSIPLYPQFRLPLSRLA